MNLKACLKKRWKMIIGNAFLAWDGWVVGGLGANEATQ
jgi:hypothetical protein